MGPQGSLSSLLRSLAVLQSKIVKRPSLITKRIRRFVTFWLRPRLSKVASVNGLLFIKARIPGSLCGLVVIDFSAYFRKLRAQRVCQLA